MDNPSPAANDLFTRRGSADAGQPESAFTALHASMGIERHLSEVFTVGEYRYSKLEDAVAQARRAAR